MIVPSGDSPSGGERLGAPARPQQPPVRPHIPRRLAYDDDGGPIEHEAHNILRRIAHDGDDGSISPAKRHQSGSSGINGHTALPNIPRRLAYDDDGGTNGRKALSIKSSGDRPPAAIGPSDIIGREALSISPNGTNGRKALTYKLIVRTQKRLPGEEVPSQLKSA